MYKKTSNPTVGIPNLTNNSVGNLQIGKYLRTTELIRRVGAQLTTILTHECSGSSWVMLVCDVTYMQRQHNDTKH